MKKIIPLILSMVACTCNSYALSFEWQDTGVSVDPSSTTLNGTMVYLVETAHSGAAPVWGSTDFVNPGNYIIYGAGLLNASGQLTFITQTTSGNWISGTTMDPNDSSLLPVGRPTTGLQVPLSGTGNRVDYYLVAFNGTTLGNSTLYQVLPYSLDATTGTAPGSVSSTPYIIGFSAGTTSGGWQPIPEPTTMALALTGFGAMMLRRRRTKK